MKKISLEFCRSAQGRWVNMVAVEGDGVLFVLPWRAISLLPSYPLPSLVPSLLHNFLSLSPTARLPPE